MIISVCKSDYFIDRSREVFLACIAEQADNRGKDNFYSPKFMDVFILSTTALEAFINERIAISLVLCTHRLALNDPVNRDTIDDDILHLKILKRIKRENLRDKYLKLPQHLWHTTFKKNEWPFRDFNFLVDIRNDIIHYKMPFYDEENLEPSWVKELSLKSFFMFEPVIIPPEPLPNERKRIWIEELCTLKAAKWAHNTTCAMIKQFSKMSKGVIQQTIDDYSDYFVEL
jgi:hypothetical protein